MAQITLEATEKSPAQAATAAVTSRLFFIDYLRAALIILVVLHHVAIVYGSERTVLVLRSPEKRRDSRRIGAGCVRAF